ncbi:MAG: Lin0512 family protein [Pseudomonadota bacterium]
MSDQRFILEMGMGNDLHGMDYQKAATRAIESALRRSTLPIFDATGISHTEMRVAVTIGVQEPDALDIDALAKGLPRGRVSITAVKGGQNVTNPDTGETLVIATAAVEAFLPSQTGTFEPAD